MKTTSLAASLLAGAAGELAAAVKRKPLPPAFSWAALVLALVLAFGVVKRAGSSSSSPLPASPALLSAAQLAAHTGLRRSKIYLAVLGTVFDVTSGKRHYGVWSCLWEWQEHSVPLDCNCLLCGLYTVI